MINKFLQQDLNRLLTPFGKVQGSLDPQLSVGSLDAQNGTGIKNPALYTLTARQEVCSFYSQLIITADGAFEMPSGWPTDGSYPSYTTVPSTLPDSLYMNGSVLTLDTSIQYYQQKRVHLTIFVDTNGNFYADVYNIPMAAPLEDQGYYSGLQVYTDMWQVALARDVLPSIDPTDGSSLGNFISSLWP